VSRLKVLGLGALTACTAWGTTLIAQAFRLPDPIPPVDALASPPPANSGEWPFVSIIVPARNEERNLPRLLPTLLAQRYPHFEVVVVDDQSTDATPRILAEWAGRDPRLRVVQGSSLPPGADWKGKPHAMHQGAQVARGAYLLFTDADTRHSSLSLSASIAYSLAQDADLLTIAPHFELVGIAEKLIMPVAYTGISILYPAAGVNNPKSPVAIANGQYILIKRTVYDSAGGIERVKDCIAEDLEFGKAIKRDGYRLRLADGRHLMSVRMYTSLPEVWEGWGKNVVLSFRGNPFQGFLGVLGTINISLTPAILVRWTWLAWSTARESGNKADQLTALWITLLAAWNTAMPLSLRARMDRLLGISPLWTLTQPIGGALLGLIMLTSLYRLVTGKGVTWKGRVYNS
jgi:chlorobactene glucosyltransferase